MCLAVIRSGPFSAATSIPPNIALPRSPPLFRAASVLWLPYQAYTLLLRPARQQPPAGEASGSGGTGGGGGAGAPSGSPLGDSALLLLLILLFHAPPQVASRLIACMHVVAAGC